MLKIITSTIILVLFFSNVFAQTSITAGQNNENISFYDFIPDKTISCSGIDDCFLQIPIDINNDSIDDLKLVAYYGFTNGEGLETYMIETLNKNEIVYENLNTSKMVKIFNQDQSIDSGLIFTKSDVYLKYRYLVGSTNINDEISSFEDKYIAVRINKDENLMFGWIKLTFQNSTIMVKESGVYKAASSAVNEIENKNYFNIFPNPNSGSFTISFNDKKFKTTTIYDSLGKLVFEKNIEKQYECKIENLQKGFYFVKLSDGNNSIIKKMVIK